MNKTNGNLCISKNKQKNNDNNNDKYTNWGFPRVIFLFSERKALQEYVPDIKLRKNS